MSLYRFTPGEKANQIPGRTWNALVDGEERDRRRGPPSVRGPEGGSEGEAPNPARVMVVNNTETLVPTGGVLKLIGVQFDPSSDPGAEYNGPVFITETPSVSDPDQNIAVAFEPLKPNAVGWATIAGVAWAKVNVSNEAHTFAKPKASVTELESSATTGYPIIWKEAGTGAGKWAVVSLTKAGGSTLVLGIYVDTVPAAAISVSGTGPAYSLSISHGFASDSVIIAQKKSDNSGWEEEPDGSDARVVGGVNFSFSRLRASTANPIAMLGYIETLTTSEMVEEEEVFSTFDVFVPANWDMSSLFGLNTGEIQVPYKDAATREVVLDAEECST